MTQGWMHLLPTPSFLIPAFGLFGLLIGSFLNVVIHRLPKMMEHDWLLQCAELREEDNPSQEPLSLSKPRSRCPACGHQITALENIPIFSWIALRGRCSACHAPISPRYPIIEALTGALFAFAAVEFGYGWAAAVTSGRRA